MVRGVLAACEECEEGGVCGCRSECVLPLLGDGDAVVEEAEGLRAPEGGEVVLDHWLVTKVDGWSVGEVDPVELQLREVGEVGEGGGGDGGERVVAEIEYCEICESLSCWGYGATQLVVAEGK